MEKRTKCLKTNYSRISALPKSIKNGVQILHTCFWRSTMYDITVASSTCMTVASLQVLQTVTLPAISLSELWKRHWIRSQSSKGSRFRQGQPGKRWRQQVIRLDCLSDQNQSFPVLSRAKPRQRCKAPFTESESSDSFQKAIRYFFSHKCYKKAWPQHLPFYNIPKERNFHQQK